MKIQSLKKLPRDLSTDLLVLVASEKDVETKKNKKSASKDLDIAMVDASIGGVLFQKIVRERFKAKALSTMCIECSHAPYQAVLVVGAPEKTTEEFDKIHYYRKLGGIIYSHAKKLRMGRVALSSKNLDLKNTNNISALLEGIHLSSYAFDRFKSEKKKEEKFDGIKELTLIGEVVSERIVSEVDILAEATSFARDLVNLPPGECTPTLLMQEAKEIARKFKLKIDLFDKAALKKMGAGGILGVTAGSDEPPYLIKLTYKPAKRPSKVISLIGKGITFDSGGLSIKPAQGMETMKCDMSGAAAVLGAMRAIAALKPKAEVRAYVPTCENMISGSATRPGDILKALNGKTIEVLNTDAEGRLILADALSLAEKDKCDIMVDLATLTGACVVALGGDYAGLFSTDDNISRRLMDAGTLSGEHFWRLPLAPEYKELIKSPIADIKNTGGKWGGAITAALFLKEFVSKTPWAHLDIAGPAFTEADQGFMKRGGAGFGVRTLVRFVKGF